MPSALQAAPAAAAFDDLSQAEQAERLMIPAQAAAERFGLSEARAHLLAHAVDSTFRVDAREGRFSLRLHRPEVRGEKTIRSEQSWLFFLRRDAGLGVPEPVAAPDGSLLVQVDVPEPPRPLLAALFRWVEGRFHDRDLTPRMYGRVGELMARLHGAGARFEVPPGFERPRYDLEGFARVVPEPFGDGLLGRRDAELLREAAEEIEARIRGLGKGSDVYGLIHGDLQQSNFLFHGDEVRAIDFADSGWGYHLFDVAASVVRLAGREDYPRLEEAFLAGYARHRPLPEGYAPYLESFMAARGIFVVDWIHRHWASPRIRQYGRESVPYILGQVRRYLERRGRSPTAGLQGLGTVDFLAHLRDLGIVLKAEDGKLRFNAPKGALTEALKGELRERKAELLEFLGAAASTVGGGASPPMEPVPRDGDLPLSFAQQRLWFFDQLEPGNPAYNIPATLELVGRLSVPALARAFSELVRRHEVLRTRFPARGGRPLQVIGAPAPVRLPLVDLVRLGEEARRRELRRLTRTEARRPFDLASGPLQRLLLWRLSEERHRLLCTTHHIASDGWSGGILVREVATLYAAFREGRPSPLPELPIQYADFAHWQRRWLTGAVLEAQLDYWRRQLAGAPEEVELPTDRPRSSARSFRGAKVRLELSRGTSEAVTRIGHGRGATPFMILLTTFGVLLHRYSGRRDLVVGTTIANRNRAAIEHLIGFFVNTLVLRVRLPEEASFLDLLDQVRQTTLEAHGRQDLPFERLVEELAPSRDLFRNPMFRVMLTYQNTPMPRLEAPGLSFRFVDPESGSSTFDLTLSAREGPNGIRISFAFRTALFDATTVQRLARHLEALAEGVAEDPGRSPGDLPMLAPAERQQLREWGCGAGGAEHPEPVHEAVRAAARRRPDAVAVTAGGRVLTYGELRRRADRLARRLARLGVAPGRPVALALEPSPGRVVAALGIVAAGGAYLPLDPSHPPRRLGLLLEDAGVPVVVTDTATAARLPAGPWRRVRADGRRASEDGGAPPDVAVPPEELAYLIYTSGSTGRPKGVEVTHRGLANLVEWHVRRFGVTENDRATLLAGPAFDASVWEVWPYLAAGASLVVPDRESRSDPSLLRDWLLRERVSVTFLPTPLAELALGLEWPSQAPLRLLLTGGDRLSHRPSPHLPFELVNDYGPTENTVVATSGRVDPGADRALPPSIGRPTGGVRAQVVDAGLRPVPTGAAGELVLGGTGLARGYRARPAGTASSFVPDSRPRGPGARCYRTGDLARWRPDGTLDFLGRMDHQVQVRGFRVELGEVADALAGHPSVAEAAVVTVGEGEGLRLAAFVAVWGDRPPPGDLRRFLAESLPEPMVPATVEVLRELPLTPNGKIDRRALETHAAAALAQGASGAGEEAPRGPVEELTAAIWCQVLGLESVGRRAHFFEIGGHSLLATRVVSRVRETFGVDLPLRRIFERPTVAGLAGAVEDERRGGGTADPPLVAGMREDPPRLAFAQLRLWFLDRLDEGSPVYNVPGALRAVGALSPTLLWRVLREVRRRHESLRTTFAAGPAGPCQVISPDVELELPVVDLSGLAERTASPELRRLAAEEASRPFDLERGPLFRAGLVRVSADDHVVLVNLHHIVADGWSVVVLFEEVAALWTAFAEGRPSPLPELPVQYADYAAWQRRCLSGGRREREAAYWRERLAGVPQRVELPTDRPHPPIQTFRGRRIGFQLRPELHRDLSALARREGVTPFMVLLALCHTLILRHAGQDDVVVGTPVAGRQHPGLESLIGFFVNTLPLRVRAPGRSSFRHLLAQAREVCLGAFSHQTLPFEQIVEAVDAPRDLSTSPVFQVLLVLQNLGRRRLEMPGVVLDPLEVERRTAKFDWTLTFVPRDDGGLAGTFEHNADLFDRTTAERVVKRLIRLVEGAVEAPGARLDELPLLAAGEVHQAVREWGRGPAVPRGQGETCLHGLFERQVACSPDAVALEAGGHALSYAELDRRADRLAHRLRCLGVGPGAPVGVCLARRWEMVAAILAVLKAGGAYVPLDPAYPRARRELMLADAGARLVLTDRTLAVDVESEAVTAVHLDDGWPAPAGEPLEPPPSAARPDDLAYLIYTSGSTGRPKGVAIEHRSAVTLVQWALRELSPAETARTLASTSICFDLSVFELFVPLARGSTVVLAVDALDLAGAAAASRVSLVNTVPSAMTELVRRGAVPSSARVVNLAGEPLPRSLVAAVYDAAPESRVLNLYGPSEDTTYSTFAVLAADSPVEPAIGRPVAGTRALVLDGEMRPAPAGSPGELYLGGRGLARCYLGRPALTAERFLPEATGHQPGRRLYRTGDLVRYRPDGDLEFRGRADHQVKLRGYRIELGEIEAALRRLPGVEEASVVVQGSPPADRLVAFIVAPEAPPPSEAGLRRSLSETLPSYMVPAAFEALAELPLTPNGKVDRRSLARRTLQRGPSAPVAPRDALELRLQRIWQEVLDVGSVGVRDRFFDLGGHSLLAIHLLTLVRDRLGHDLPLSVLFQAPTIERLAGAIRGRLETPEHPCLVPLLDGDGPPFFCVHGAGGHVFRVVPLARRLAEMGVDRRFYAVQAKGLMGDGELLRSVPAMADHYLDAILAVQPEGPYFLGGCSMGGLVAYHMARRLRADGREVALLAVLDSHADPADRLAAFDDTDLLVGLAGELRVPLDEDEVAGRPLEEVLRRILEKGWALERVPRELTLDRARRYLEVVESTLEAARSYRAEEPYDGEVVVFKAGDNLPQVPPELGWDAVARAGVRARVVPGDHQTFLEEPHVEVLARHLGEFLR